MILNFICKLKGKTKKQLRESYSWHYFLTRSCFKATLLTIIK